MWTPPTVIYIAPLIMWTPPTVHSFSNNVDSQYCNIYSFNNNLDSTHCNYTISLIMWTPPTVVYIASLRIGLSKSMQWLNGSPASKQWCNNVLRVDHGSTSSLEHSLTLSSMYRSQPHPVLSVRGHSFTLSSSYKVIARPLPQYIGSEPHPFPSIQGHSPTPSLVYKVGASPFPQCKRLQPHPFLSVQGHSLTLSLQHIHTHSHITYTHFHLHPLTPIQVVMRWLGGCSRSKPLALLGELLVLQVVGLLRSPGLDDAFKRQSSLGPLTHTTTRLLRGRSVQVHVHLAILVLHLKP